ncbi:LysE family translocator [Herbaspirillum rhizosphaerae]|uniref:LysE family translocator n=1 Tax=Herbaspirillum rhizosphaerae TaxID=346179 RepID=UPI00067B4F86|nr:LysE family translocator [Herbaspirillum rhizosphaerae]
MSLITFVIAASILAITPGPGIAYVVAKTVSGGRVEGLASCIGTAVGGLLHVLAAALGLSLIVAKSAIAFNAIKFIGAAYLVFLGIQLLRRKNERLDASRAVAQGWKRALAEGIVVEALNIKTALFFLAFLPQFVSANISMTEQVAFLGGICVLLNTLVDVIAVFAAARILLSEQLRLARARMMARISGVTMIFLGIFLATAKRSS